MNPLPFFRKKRQQQAESPKSPASPPSAPSPEDVEVPDETPGETPEPEAEPQVESQSRDDAYSALTEAFATWRSQLSAGHKDYVVSLDTPGVLDISGIHPAGAAQFFSGSPTPLRSLFREQDSLTKARKTVSVLVDKIDDLERTYGSAPLSFVMGLLTWSEITPGKTGLSSATAAGAEEDVDLQDLEETPEGESSTTDQLTSNDETVRADDIDDTDDHSVETDTQGGENDSAETGEDHVAESQSSPEEHSDQEDAGRDDTEPEHTSDVETEPAGAEDASAEPNTGATVIEMVEPALRREVYVASGSASDPVFTLADGAEVSSAVLDGLRRHGAPTEAVAEIRKLARVPETQEQALRQLRDVARVYLPGCEFTPVTVIGIASSPSEIILDDLVAMEPDVRQSELLADIVTGQPRDADWDTSDSDRDPALERGAGALDVSELDAVDAVANGHSVFLHTAPGSRPKHVLASIAADQAASGKTVLYISGQPRSQQAFTRHLSDVGLGEMIADFSTTSKVPLRLRQGLRLKSGRIESEKAAEANARLEEGRQAITDFETALHNVDPQWGIAPYQLLNDIVTLSMVKDGPRPRVRLSQEALAPLGDHDKQVALAGLLDEAIRIDGSVSKDNPWQRATITSDEEAKAGLDHATQLADRLIDTTVKHSTTATEQTGLRQATTMNEWGSQLDLYSEIGELLDTFRPRVFERSVTPMIIATGSKEWRADNGHDMGRSDRRRLRREAADMVRPGRDVGDLHEELKRVEAKREQWAGLAESGTWPELPSDIDTHVDTYVSTKRELDALASILPDGDELGDVSFDALHKRVKSLARESGDLKKAPRRHDIGQQLDEAGLTELLDDMKERRVPGSRARDELNAAYLASVFEHMFSTVPELAESRTIRSRVTEVTDLDAQHVATMPDYINRAFISRMRSLITKHQEETLQVDRLLEEHGVAGLREAISTSGEILTSGRPIWILNTVTMAQYVPPVKWADIVILDSIDTMDLAQLVPAILRGSTLVVAGDKKGSETLTTLATALPVIDLPPVAAQFDELTATFLTDHEFATDLSVYPSAPSRPRPRVHIVDGTGVPGPSSGLVEGPEKEVSAVVDAVVNLALTRQGESIAVIAANEVHANKIRAEIRHLARTSASLTTLTDPLHEEAFTVVDLANAAGVVRDHIILTVGLGKTVHGRLLHSFGMLSTDAGFAGLVSAIQGARQSLTIISSFANTDIDRDRVSTPGPLLLMDLLEFYRSRPTSGSTTDRDATPLLEDLASRLRSRGYQAKLGYSNFDSKTIPMVVGHEDIPGTWCVAVTLDDEAYAHEPSLRRRTRFATEALTQHGWSVVDVYATEVFFEPNAQVTRLIDAVNEVRDSHRTSAKKTPVADSSRPSLKAVRGPRPHVTPGLPLAAYSDEELDDLLAWIVSDGVERTEEQKVADLRSELDLGRKGPQVDAILSNVVRRSQK